MSVIEKLFEDVTLNYLKFEEIHLGDRLHPNRRLCGLLKVYSLTKEKSKFYIHAEHDTVYLADADELKPLSYEDALYLARCGVSYDKEFDCLVMYC